MDAWVKTALLTASVLSCINPALAAPSRPRYDDGLYNSSHPFAEFGVARQPQARQQQVALRILGVGASIMSGTGSSTGNGLRKPLRDALRQDGYEVDMVGSLHGGTMIDYEHEAVPGDVLTQILARVPRSTGYKPNIVIINGGTNDGNGNVDIAGVGTRMNNVLNAIWDADDMSGTCIMLSTLIPTTNANGAANRDAINSQYRSLVTQRYSEGKCIYLADMDLSNGQQWFQFDTDYLVGESPHVHPNDKGHRMMAAAFYEAIYHALDDGRVVTAPAFEVGVSVCDKEAGTGVDAGGLTQRGSGYGDGIYYHDSQEMGIIWTADSDWDRDQWKFARLFDRDYDDLVAWVKETDTSQVYAVWANSGDGKASFTQMSDLIPDLNCQYPEGVNFIDMNADGLDDLVYIDADGNAYLSINQGDGNRAAGKSPTFKRVSDTAKIKSTEGYARAQVVLADIDGDGRGDYGVIDVAGNVYFWRNGWIDDIPAYWQSLGKRMNSPGFSDNRGFKFEDINGDGRDDFVWLSDVGRGYIWTNARSCATGVEGNGLNVAWRQGYLTGTSSGAAYLGMGSFVTDDEDYLRDRIHFARIYGQSTVFGNLPKQDYVFMQHTKLSSGKHRFQMRVWKNTGAGATKLLADGNKYCNMMGHSNGMVDYVWAYSFGRMEMWANRGKGVITDSDADGYWNYQGTIWDPPSDMNRRDLHLQDWDGDGDCDIIYADPESGAVQVWINNYPETGSWDWTYLSNPAPGLSCSQKSGLGFSDLAVRFADITGNNRADYLCIEPDSRVTGFVQNDDGSFENVGQIKVSISKDRANLRWADVNGDGKDDLIWVEKFSGDGYVWYNEGRGDPSDLLGSTFSWRQQDEVAYAGNSAGTCEYWADLDGNGRADEHFILGTLNNEARTALNPSCGLQDKTGDDATFADPLTAELAEYGTGTGSSGDDTTNVGSCAYDPDVAESWSGSGAADLLDRYILAQGTDAWLKGMDVQYYTHDQSTINCDSISSNDCSAPDVSCSSYDTPGYWYVKTMASRLNSHFKSAHETLQDSTIRNLGKVDTMLADFKEEVPDKDWLADIFKTLALSGTIGGVFAKRATAYAGDFLTLLGAGLNLASNSLKAKDPADYDEIAAAVEDYITQILDNGMTWIDSILPQFYGDGDDGDLALVHALLSELEESGLSTPQDGRSSDISSIMDGGGFMVPVSKSTMSAALTASIDLSLLSVLGHILSSLHYMVVGVPAQAREACEFTYGAQWVNDACHYLVVRPKGSTKSQTVDQEHIDLMQNTYGVNMAAMYANVAACNNANFDIDNVSNGGLYLGTDDYPPCWFNIVYVYSGALDYPISFPQTANKATLPDWVESGTSDLWDEPRTQLCKLDAYKDGIACSS